MRKASTRLSGQGRGLSPCVVTICPDNKELRELPASKNCERLAGGLHLFTIVARRAPMARASCTTPTEGSVVRKIILLPSEQTFVSVGQSRSD